MLSRILSLHSRIPLRLIITPLTTSSPLKPLKPQTPKPRFFPFYPRHFSTNNNNGNGGSDNDPNPASNAWNISQQPDDLEDIFGIRDDTPPVNPPPDPVGSNKAPASGTDDLWAFGGADDSSVASQVGGGGDGDVFEEFVERESGERGEAEVEPWKLGEEEKEGTVDDVFELDDETDETFSAYDDEEEAKRRAEREMIAAAEKLKLEKEEKALLEVIKGPDRAFGDLVAASGITDAMLDSLIALKNFQDIEGLPPLAQIEDERYEKTLMKSSRHEMELQKQEDAAKSRVRKVDEKGRAYGTGKRKCSIARVWIQPGEGKFFINDKEFDVYFPMLDHRASLLRPFSETKTLGLWDVKCTVQGGGVSGQVGAIRLGVSRALQNWEPGLRPPLKEAGFLTRDPRVVERKKPGKAKARKSFQWVKR